MRMERVGRRAWVTVLALAAMAAMVVAASGCGSSSSSGASSGSGSSGTKSQKKFEVYLDINGTFNSWRTQMQHIVEFAAKNPPLGDKVNFHFVDSAQDVAGQTTDLNNIIAKKPDAILLDAASSTALNPLVKRACAQGITIVSFDNVVSEPCAYKVGIDVERNAMLIGNYIAQKINGKGEVVIDQALPGAAVADQTFAGFKKAMGQFPGIKIVGTLQSKFTPGLVKSQLAPILSAHPKVNAIMTPVIIKPALEALQAAHLPPVAQGSTTITNDDVAACVKADVPCAVASVPPYLAAEALKAAVGLLDGTADKAKKSLIVTPAFLFTQPPPSKLEGFPEAVLEQAKPVPGVRGDLTLPVAPSWLKITPQQAAGS